MTDIKPLLKSDKANGARLHSASGLGAAHLAQPGGTVAPLRHLLFAIRETAAARLLAGRLRSDQA